MKNITFDDVKKMWMDSPEKESIIEFYCYKNGLKSDKIIEDDKNKIYAELYPLESFIRDYMDTFLFCGEVLDDEVK